MAYQKVFKRYELKYMLTLDQKNRILRAMDKYMTLDKFGRSTIRNIYFDTDDYILARHSVAKPDFKEKLRIRSYSQVTGDDEVFVELKRKYDHVVYKRRVALPETDAMAWTTGARKLTTDTDASICNASSSSYNSSLSPQLTDEISYFLGYYKNLRPAVFLSYDREAYKMRPGSAEADGGSDFRVTFDENILCRDHDLSLCSEVYGEPILEKGKVLMELKCSGGIPLWMTEVLSEEKIYKTSFSKYGTVYTRFILPEFLAASRMQAKAAAHQAENQTTEHKTAKRNVPSAGKHARKGWLGSSLTGGFPLTFARRTA